MLEAIETCAIDETASSAALEALRAEWHELWLRCPDATPFQSPAWLVPWWRQFGGGELLLLTARRQGRLVALLPLTLVAAPHGRTALLVGTGVTDYLDGLFAPETARAVAADFLHHLARRSGWELCDFQQLRETSPLLATAAPPGLVESKSFQEACPVVLLSPAGMRPSVAPVHLRRCRRRAEKAGAIAFESANDGNLDELLDALLRLHGARWAERGGDGVLADDAVRRFHRDAARAMLALGLLRLHVLRLDGRIVASYYGFAAKGRHYAYLGGFDPTLPRLSLGSLVIDHAIAAARDEGAEEFHFLRGREAYKYEWGAVDRPTYRRQLRRQRPGAA